MALAAALLLFAVELVMAGVGLYMLVFGVRELRSEQRSVEIAVVSLFGGPFVIAISAIAVTRLSGMVF